MAVDDEPESEESDDLANADADDIEEEEAALAPDDDDEESDEASLEELLAQRSSARRGGDDTEEEEADDIMALSSEKDTPATTALPTKVIPIKDQQEFVCQSCYLVKARSQLADERRMYCRDCA